MSKKIAIIGSGRQDNTELIKAITQISLQSQSEIITDAIEQKEFKEQRLYDLINELSNVRYEKPIFHKCKSCGFEVVNYQLDRNGICNDCREEKSQ